MNKKQKYILRIGALFATFLLLFPSFIVEVGDAGSSRGLGHSFLLSPPKFLVSSTYGFVDAASLLVELTAIVTICAALWFSEKD